ncbi:MAG TPA: hypothetical protein VIF57_01240 [Polyangia bacterium]|jgi:hypothetical protein
MTESEISDLVGYAYPAALPIEGRTGWLRRRWVVRTSRDIDEAVCAQIGDRVTRNIRAALLDSGVPAEALARGAPTVRLSVLDARHAIMCADCVGPNSGIDVGDAATAANWGALQQLDAELGIDELEGLPRRFWKLLVGARGK